MTSSSGWNVRIASSIACTGSVSPISPSTSIPAARIEISDASSRACAASRAPSSSFVHVFRVELSAGATTNTLALRSPAFSRIWDEQLWASDGLVRDDEDAVLVGRARRGRMPHRAARRGRG